MNIAIIGGTFNPIHEGHLKMAEIALSEMKLDKVFFMPTRLSPLKNNSNLVSNKDRIAMIKIAINNNPNYDILYEEIYSKNKKISYTIDTIKKIKSKYINSKINFIIGTDQLNQLDRWKEIDKLSNLVQIVVIQRPGYQISESNVIKYNVTILKSKSVDISSSAVRDNPIFASSEITKYIYEHKLYIEDRIKPYMSIDRYNHTISVKNRAVEYAKNNKISTKKPIIASLLHDICKELVDFQLKNIILQFYDYAADGAPEIYHQYAAEYIAMKDFNITDPAILSAIRKHATGDIKMSKLDKIIYCADKTESTRHYSDLDYLVSKCNQNIEDGFIEVLKSAKKYYENQGIKAAEVFEKVYLKYAVNMG